MTDAIVGSLPGQSQQQVDPAALAAGAAATAPPAAGPLWLHHGVGIQLSPDFDARAVVHVQRGNLLAALELMVADPARDIDRVLEAGPLRGEDIERAITVWAEPQAATPGE